MAHCDHRYDDPTVWCGDQKPHHATIASLINTALVFNSPLSPRIGGVLTPKQMPVMLQVRHDRISSIHIDLNTGTYTAGTAYAKSLSISTGLSKKWGLPFHLRVAPDPPPSSEGSAREWRYQVKGDTSGLRGVFVHIVHVAICVCTKMKYVELGVVNYVLPSP